MEIRRGTFREPKITDPGIHFPTHHDVVMAVSRMLTLEATADPTIPKLLLMELDEELPAYDEEAEADEAGNAPYIDKTATPLYFDAAEQTWKKDQTQQKQTVCNPYPEVYPKETRMPFLYLAQAAKFIPLSAGLLPRVSGYLLADLDTRNTAASADVHVWEAEPGGEFTATDPEVTTTVYPTFASQLGVILEGMKIEAEFDSGGYRVTSGGKCRHIWGTVKDAFTTANDTFTMVYIGGCEGEDPVAVNADIAIQNSGNIFYGITGDYVADAVYAPEIDAYRLVQKECTVET